MWNISIDEVFKYFNSSKKGLTQEEAQKRIKINGKNLIPKAKKKTLFETFVEQFKSPIILILFVSVILSIITKNYADSFFILAVIFINSIIGTYQEWKAEKDSQALQNLIRIKSKVIRDYLVKNIDSEDITLGDIVLLEAGDKVPADLKLIETYELLVDESILTGESITKTKDADSQDETGDLLDRKDLVYAGTIIIKGRAKGIVVGIGKNTEFGKIAKSVIEREETKSPLVVKMDKFTKQISVGFIILASLISIFLYIKGYAFSDILSTVVALTVSAIPEGLTIAMTIVLSIAASKMAKRNVIVKKLNAVESLGSCTRIATDKTGTLTVNEQTAKKIVLPSGDMIYITGAGYNDNGSYEAENNISNNSIEQMKEIAKLGVLANEASLLHEEGKWKYHGDAIDMAFLALGYKMEVKKENHIIDMIPYESRLKYSAVLYEENRKINVAMKGGIEKVLEFCTTMLYKGEIVDLNYNKIINQADELSSQGFRVIALAKKNNIKFQNDKFTQNDIPKLTYMGMVAFVDPIREDVVNAIYECKKAGIGITMITGDYKLTAETIAKRLEIEEVYARVTPMDKLNIVEKLKGEGEIIAVTGDGVNDTPALKVADIGVAMGSGTDIAKETGSMIIVDDNFSSIVHGIEEGRRAYNNIRKVIYLLLSTGFSEIILFIFSIIVGLPIPLLAIQFLWLNLISNGIQGDALAFEKDIEDVMNKKTKRKKEVIFNKLLIIEIAVSAVTMAVIEFIMYIYITKTKQYDITTIRSLLLTLMVFIENIHIFNCRSENLSIFKIPIKNNIFLIASIIITTLIQILIVTNESLASIFKLSVISGRQIIILLILTIPVIIIMEIFKLIKKHNSIKFQ